MNGDLQPQLKWNPSVLDMDKMITVEYEEEATRFFPQRLLLRIASTAAMFHTRRMDEPPNGLFWQWRRVPRDASSTVSNRFGED